MKRSRKGSKQNQIKDQIQKRVNGEKSTEKKYDGNDKLVVSTGSTLLDLAISGGRIEGGGVPTGILVEIFGPPGAGKTVLLCEIAGNVQRSGGEVLFRDPEARLNKQFASLFGLNPDEMDYSMPSTVPEIFAPIREWEPKESGVVNGVFADSLAALSTNLEMEGKDGDKMGMRRAKEFSEECRKTCRILTNKNLLMVCSNQVRQNMDAGPYGQKFISPGGQAIGFYASLRLRISSPKKIPKKIKRKGKELVRYIGVESEIEVHKSSIWEPYHTAPISIMFNYGIDDIQENLKFLKSMRKETTYNLGGNSLGNSLERAIAAIESDKLEKKLKKEVIDLWNEIEEEFKTERKPKRRV